MIKYELKVRIKNRMVNGKFQIRIDNTNLMGRRSRMITTKEAFIDAKEVSQILGVGMTKAYSVIKAYNAELDAEVTTPCVGNVPVNTLSRRFTDTQITIIRVMT